MPKPFGLFCINIYPKTMKLSLLPRLLAPLILIYFFSGVAVSGARVAASLWSLQMGASEFLVGTLVGLYALLPMFCSVHVGRWADRVGPLVPLRIGVLAIVCGAVLLVLFPHLVTLFAMMTLCGIGFNLVTVSGQYAVGQLQCVENGSNRVANFGWFSLGQSSANVVGPIVAGLLIDHTNYRFAFMGLVVFALFALICIVFKTSDLNALHHGSGAAQATVRKKVWTLIGTPSMRRIYIIGVLISVVWDIFTFLMPIFGHRLQLSASVIGAILAAFAAGTFCIRMIMPWFSRRFTEWQILLGSMVLMVLVYLALPLTLWVPLLLVLGFLFGMAVGCSQPNMLSLLHANAPAGRGAEAVGFRQMLCNASGVFVPLLFGATVASFGALPLFWAVAAATAAALPVAYREIQAQKNIR